MNMIRLGISNVSNKSTNASPALSQVLCEAQAWCSLQHRSDFDLRSPELDPSAIIRVPWKEDVSAYVRSLQESYRRAVFQVVRERSILLKELQATIVNTLGELSGGKLLLYEPLENVSDGAAEASSHGFFDANDAPPWDTWITYLDDAIVSWVPESMIPSAQAGIDANPVDCIHWISPQSFSRLR
jgi:hypothetical protein